jgi:hypothetical protein
LIASRCACTPYSPFRLRRSAQIGDEILTFTGERFEYSPVAFLPHSAINNHMTELFVHIETESVTLLASHRHLIMIADCISNAPKELLQAGELSSGVCVLTTQGAQRVVSAEMGRGKGLYSAVPLNGALLVVNGIVASPFVISHTVPNAFYALHRALYQLSPSSFKQSAEWIQVCAACEFCLCPTYVWLHSGSRIAS